MKLLESIQVGQMTLKNRVAITAHTAFATAYHSSDNGDQYAAYLELRAAGGAGLITLQGLFVPPVDESHPFPYDYLEDRLRRFTTIAHDHGAAVLVQTQHVGAKQRGDANPDMEPLWGFSPVVSDASGEVAHAMEAHEVESVVEGWGRVAELAIGAGLDGIELHGSHGYLLHQSISPWMNWRDDEWGKPLRFWNAVLERVRAGLGPNGILGTRIPSDDLQPLAQGGLGAERLRELASQLVATGLVDYVNPTEGSGAAHYGHVVGTYRRPHGDFLPGVAAIRAALEGAVPVLGVGRITTVREAEAALQRGDCDFVGMTRAHIADPDVVRKLIRGDEHRIRPCVGANQGCLDRVHSGQQMTCFHNPDVGREFRIGPIVPSRQPRRVLIVGGGPAGLKAAEIAQRRGHHVVLVERGDRLGGRLGSITGATSASELVASVIWIEQELEILGVDVQMATEVDEHYLQNADMDGIVLATGSCAAPLPFGTDESVPVLRTEEAMALIGSGAASTVLVHDVLGNEEAAVVYEQLAAAGIAVTVTTPNAVVGVHIGHTHAVDHVERLLRLGCVIHERTDLVGVAKGLVVTRNRLTGNQHGRHFDVVVMASQRLPELSLQNVARRLCRDVRVIGDASAPRTAMHAFREGDNIGRAL
jgi:2,4-dienoyl-CoA reductase-like NADH-dependent reductase (Old Yellow Enzyme family)